MKNIQVIDAAENCVYSIFQTEDSVFRKLFPKEGQDIEFIEDVLERMNEKEIAQMMASVWSNRIEKKNVSGIHGTLFYGLQAKKKFYPNKRESDADLPLSI